MSEAEDALIRRIQATRQIYQQGLGKQRRSLRDTRKGSLPTVFRGIDTTQGMVIYQQGGQQRVSREMITNALVQRGDRVRVTGRGLNSWLDAVPRIKRQEVVATVEEITTPTSAIPILFTKLNADGDREYWLGGDRDEPLLLDTLPVLNLLTEDWLVQDNLAGTTTIHTGPTPTLSLSGSATNSGIGDETLEDKVYIAFFTIDLPTYLLAKETGNAVSQYNAGGLGRMYVGAGTVSAGGPVAPSLDALSRTKTDTDSTLTFTNGQTYVTPNWQVSSLRFPGLNSIAYSAGITFDGFSGQPPITGSYDVELNLEFIPCYLASSFDTRFVILQPSPGVLNYYEISATDNTFTKTEFSAPATVETSTDDWRAELASHTPVSFPFSTGDFYKDTYWKDYGPWGVRQLSNPGSGFLNGGYAANLFDDKLFLFDCALDQDGEVDFTRLYLHYLYSTFELDPDNPGNLIPDPGVLPLVNTQDIEVKVTSSELDPPSGLINPVDTVLTARSLNTPDALILAIAPVVVEES